MSESYNFYIRSTLKKYRVDIGIGIAQDSINNSDVFIVDSRLPALFPWIEKTRSIFIVASEEKKNLQTVAEVMERMRELGVNRRNRITAIGGGIIQDISTFVAANYMRGVEWSYLPSTLLGMVDSCIGGKSSLNVGPYKNIAGNFYPPTQVIVDTVFCKTLSHDQMAEGLLEAAKICYVSRGHEFSTYLEKVGELQMTSDPKVFFDIIKLSLQAKKFFIESDEFDTGVRLLLNFGHTFGHAIEGATEFRISHGFAVGVGMLCAADFSMKLNLVGPDQPRLSRLIVHVKSVLSQATGLKQALSTMSSASAMNRFCADKKHLHGKYTVIAIGNDGFPEILVVDASGDYREVIQATFDRVLNTLF